MFTEGLDESAINWIKQDTGAESETRSAPLTEKFDNRYLFPRSPLAYSSGSSRALPPLKFHSGLLVSQNPVSLGLESSYEDDFDDDYGDDNRDTESVASVPMELDGDDSDEDFLNKTVHGNYEEMSNQKRGANLIQDTSIRAIKLNRGLLKENLCIKVPGKSQKLAETELTYGVLRERSSVSGGSCRLHDRFQTHSAYSTPIGKLNDATDLGTPSAPPIMEVAREVDGFDGESGDKESGSIPGLHCFDDELMSKDPARAFDDVSELIGQNEQSSELEAADSEDKAAQLEGERQAGMWKEKSVEPSPCYDASDQNAWQILLAYDACIRLCLNAWARGCTEAPEFLRDECMLLRRAFGLHKFLLQPQGMRPAERTSKTSENLLSSRCKQIVGKLRVEVKKLRIIPRRKLKNANSWRGIIHMQAGAEYVRHVSSIVKHGISSIKLAQFSSPAEEPLSCLAQLKSAIEDDQAETRSVVTLLPGNGDYHDFFPESQGDQILLEVQDVKKNIQGRTTISVSEMVENAADKTRWWPIYHGDHECVGKIQLSISCTSMHDEIAQSKNGPIVETMAYDLLLEAALRAQSFQARNLQIGGHWKWLLKSFAEYYGVSDSYARLRYLSHIMNVATPTKDCLDVLHDLLEPVLEARNEKALTRQEKSLLLNCETQVESLLSDVFQNYKSLDENSTTGLADIPGLIMETAAPALAPAVQVYTLLHDILAEDAQTVLRIHLQKAALRRCRKHMLETDEFLSNNSDGFVVDPMAISTSYLRMKNLCINISSEIQADIKIHNEHVLPSSIDLPSITGTVYSTELCKRLRAFLSALPPSSPASHVTELLIATADFQRNLDSWNISTAVGGVDSRDLYHNYIMVWIEDMQLCLLDQCKSEKVPWSGVITNYSSSPFAEEIYDRLKVMLHEYEVVINRWPEYTLLLENAAANVERAIIKALEKQYYDILTPLRNSVPQKLGMQVQKLTRRQSIIPYSVPVQLGTFLNTIKRILDVLHRRTEDMLKAWASCLPVNEEKKSSFGEQMNAVTVILRTKYKNYMQAIVVKLADNMNAVTVILRTKYKNYMQAIVVKLADNVQANRSTRLQRILEETKVTDGEADIRERMQILSKQLSDSISNLHEVCTSHLFVAICRGLWEKMGQIVVKFLESRKENRIWYSGSYHALGVLEDVFASQMQRLQGNAIKEKDLEPPRSILEARSILCRDTRNGVESSNYLYI